VRSTLSRARKQWRSNTLLSATRYWLVPYADRLGAMFLQQMFASVGKVLPAVLAPLVIAELHADPAWVGVYYGISAAASLVVQMGCGSCIIRYGALRMSQVVLVLLGGGMAVAAEGSLPGFGASAIIGGGGGAVSTPTSSQLLYRVSPPRLAPLVFSIKQTAVPAGLLICGFLGPTMAGALGWRGVARCWRRRQLVWRPQLCCSRCGRGLTTTECPHDASGCLIFASPLLQF